MIQVQDFFDIRERILKNSIYNLLLTAKLSKKSMICVGKSLLQISPKLKAKLKSTSKANYLMCNIFASLTPIFPKIGYSCGEPADITWTHYPKALPGGYISNLRTLSEEIFKAYQINASHQDKIFSNAPSSFFVFLEANKFSRNLWTVGFPKRIPKYVVPDNAETELTKYYNTLITRNIDWTIFNAILISLIKEDKFEAEKEGVGKLKISKTALNSQLHVEFTSYENDSHHSILVHEYDMNPSAWEAREYEVTLFDLRNMF